MERIYLDYAATTPLDNRVLEQMLPWFTEDFGNPSSIHFFGQKAETAVENSRKVMSDCLGGKDHDIIFTSGGTESDNLALRGVALYEKENCGADEIIISSVEHHAVKSTAEQLRDHFGFKLIYVNVDHYGTVDLQDLEKKISEKTAIVSIIYANNEIGTINPVKEIGELCQKRRVAFHSDGVQAAAHLDVDLERDHIDLFSLGAHKFYGPKGVGALAVRSKYRILPILTGGKQEENRRAGTHNVPSIIGMTEALRIVGKEKSGEKLRLSSLRDGLVEKVINKVPGSMLTGNPQNRLPNHASFVFEKVNGNQLLIQLDMMGFACSSGSACKIGDPTPSDVLLAIGIDPETALGSLRVTLGRSTTYKEIEAFLSALPAAIEQVRRFG